ncbi:MAG: type II/IV secretion system protein [Candidatus Jacksonbacteria bacterium]|nr:type II/IV secretion system protein [Candidatus Jacksonbacteria bacterium]
MSSRPQISDTTTEQALSSKLRAIDRARASEGAKTSAAKLGVEFIDLVSKTIPTTTAAIIPETIARSAKAVAYYKDKTALKLAALEPSSARVKELADDLTARHHLKVSVNLATEEGLESAFKTYQFIRPEEASGIVRLDENAIHKLTVEILDYREITEKVPGASISDAVNLLLASALKINASDIHLQPESAAISVRFRIDGVLHHVLDLQKEKFSQIKKRIKLISHLKLNVEKEPQDGSFSIKIGGNSIDLRVATLPSHFGESIVIRILNPQGVVLSFPELGVNEYALPIFAREIKKPNGMIITTGPTGSGKTTTLYTILNTLNEGDRQIITLEDPIEYKIPGIVQTQVDSKMGFATGLRAILRQDPDIIMVGEIRDLETAETAINAALTGHLVISTLHTNSAPAAIPRFLAMGVKPFLLAPSLNLVIGQRLVRRICEYCKVPFSVSDNLLTQAKTELSRLPKNILGGVDLNALVFYQGHSCKKCHGLGFKGRVGVYEFFPIDEKLAATIGSGNVSSDALAKYAESTGMITMVQDGLLKAIRGITTIEEVFRVAK